MTLRFPHAARVSRQHRLHKEVHALARICILVQHTDRFEPVWVAPSAQMPCIRRFAFPVSAFLSGCNTDVCWTDARALWALDELYAISGVRFSVRRAFARIASRCCSERCQRHLGATFFLGDDLNALLRAQLYRHAVESGLFPCVCPPFRGGGSVVVSQARYYPMRMAMGAHGVSALALQDALIQGGLHRGALTGRIDGETIRAVRRLRLQAGLPASETVDRSVFLAAMKRARLTKPHADATIGGNRVEATIETR